MPQSRILLLLALVIASMSSAPVVTMAKAKSCSSLNTQAKISYIAKQIVQGTVDREVNDCYQALTDEEKAAVFESMAVERGISVEKLRKEAADNAKNRQDVVPDDDHSDHQDGQAGQRAIQPLSTASTIRPMTHSGSAWRQLVERIPFSAVFKPLVYASSSYADALCDGDASDVDYMFSFVFSFNVSNPDNLRSFSYNVGVDSMLVYYQTKYGGIDGRGYTDRPGVWVCLGDNGVATAGGETTVRNSLTLHY